MLGPNGAGKSSLVLAMAGVLPISGGSVTLDGRHLDGLRARRYPAARASRRFPRATRC